MKEVHGNLWDYIGKGWIVVTTNGFVRKNGTAVMGRGVAKECSIKFPYIPATLGAHIGRMGNHLLVVPGVDRLIMLPVKHVWWDPADIDLIKRSIGELVDQATAWEMEAIYMPRPGCGNGGLNWFKDIRPWIKDELDDRFTIVERNL